ncbi:MAG: hypothetical protein JWN72_1302, partial [Thermoleophilia bacterium]|nr:hypothetical protein [Thermoleophilia bacterium]
MDVVKENYLDEIARQIRGAVSSKKLPPEDTHGLFRNYAVLLLA